MLKATKFAYADEEVIDGFSILCFESCRSLERYSMFRKNYQKVPINEQLKVKTYRVLKESPKKEPKETPNKTESKPKFENLPVSPTRITAQRKSKPDIATLSLAINKSKRRQSTSPVKRPEDRNRFNHTTQFIEKDMEIENYSVIISDDNVGHCNEISGKENKTPEQEICNLSIIDDCFKTETSLNATSTLSPFSLQPSNCLQGDIEDMDIGSPKVDLECNSSSQEIDIIDTVKIGVALPRETEIACHTANCMTSLKENELTNFLIKSVTKDTKYIEEILPKDNGTSNTISTYVYENGINKCKKTVLLDENEDCNKNLEVEENKGCEPNNKNALETECKKNIHCSQNKQYDQNKECDQNNNSISNDSEDDCVIVSVEFDPNPKLANIPLSFCEKIFPDIPKLNPAPFFFQSCYQPHTIQSSRHALIPNIDVQPPPLTPAPRCYFSQNNRHDVLYNRAQRSVHTPKMKSSKKCSIKSSILKPSQKCIKCPNATVAKTTLPTELSHNTDSSNNLCKPFFSHLNQYNGKNVYSIHINSVPDPSTLSYSSTSMVNLPSRISDGSIPSNRYSIKNTQQPPYVTSLDIQNQSKVPPMNHGQIMTTKIFRRTRNHVDIVHQISRCVNRDKKPFCFSCKVIKPRALKPLYSTVALPTHLPPHLPVPAPQPYASKQPLLQETVTSPSMPLVFNNPVSQYLTAPSLRPTQTFGTGPSLKSNELPIIVRPIMNTAAVGGAPGGILFNPHFTNPISISSKPNFLLLQ